MAESKPRISNALKIKLAIAVVLLVLAGVLILQNWEEATMKIFWQPVRMPHAILLALMLVIGFVAGVVTTWAYQHRRS